MKKYFAVLLVIALMLASCDMMQDAVRSAKKDAQPGYGTVQVVFTSGEEARTVFPSLDFDKVVYTFEKSGSTALILEPDDKGFFALELGQWQVTVEAYTEAGGILYLVASDKSGLFTVNSNTVLQVPIRLKAVDETSGTGTFTFSIAYPEEAEIERLTLINLSSNSAISLAPVTDGNSMSQTLAVPAGYYQFTIRLRIDSRQAGTSEVVHIYSRATTEYNKVFSDEDFSYRTVSMSGFDITGLGAFTYSGSPIGVTIEPQSGKSPGEITIYYDDGNGAVYTSTDEDPDAPVNAGTYTVTFDVEAADGFEPVNGAIAGVLIINKKQVVIDGLGAANKVYDGTTVVTLTGTASLLGLIGEDDVTIIPGTAVFASATAGDDIAVLFSGYSIGGESVGNYELTSQPVGVTADIDKKQLTISGVSATSRAYDTTTAVVLTGGTLVGVETGDVVSFALGAGTMTNANAGDNKAVTTTIALAGADQGNYTLTQPDYVTVNITKAAGGTVSTPTIEDKTDTSITLNAVSTPSTGQVVEYARNSTSTTPTTGWQTGLTFSDLNPLTQYYLFARSKENDNYNTGTASGGLAITTRLIEMTWIPAGTFTMGSPTNEPGRYTDEIQHEVTLTSGFYMGVYQVTQDQYLSVTGSNPSGWLSDPTSEEIQGKRPVERVTWYDAVEFCNTLSILEGLSSYYIIDKVNKDPNNTNITDTIKWTVTINSVATGYRLPTEAQWEYACRAGTITAFNDGVTNNHADSAVGLLAWLGYPLNSITHEVGKKKANAWGLYDMHGNVWEWCWDWKGNYPGEAETDPIGAFSGTSRVRRGGYNGPTDMARSAFRGSFDPSLKDSDAPPNLRYNVGFRLVRP